MYSLKLYNLDNLFLYAIDCEDKTLENLEENIETRK